MNKLLKIDNIMYRVSDLKKAEEFYINVLGLQKAWEDQDAKMIGFKFEQSDSETVIHNRADIPEGDFSYLVEEVVAFCEDIKKRGYNVCMDPIDVRPGKYAVISDPDGNKIPVIDLSKFGGTPKYD